MAPRPPVCSGAALRQQCGREGEESTRAAGKPPQLPSNKHSALQQQPPTCHAACQPLLHGCICASAAVLPTWQLGPGSAGPAVPTSHLLVADHPNSGEVAPPQLVQHGVAPVLELLPHPHAVVAACMGATGQGRVGVRRLAAAMQAGMKGGRATGRGGVPGGRLLLLQPLMTCR